MIDGLYLGGTVAPDGELAGPFSIEAEDLRTHGVVVGMTGSGKTGLCLVLLEELARAGVPVIAIDPKGDLANLGLLFPTLQAADFAPWVEQGDGSKEAGIWSKGLAKWGLGSPQVQALTDQLALTVYTPGSSAGVPVDVLGAFRRPSGAVADDPDARRSLVAGTVSGLLGLVGRKTDPVRDPAHIVLSQVMDAAWAAGEDLDLETLILRLVDPPFSKVGVFPLDRFFSPGDRMDLAMQLNGVIASPTFAAWSRGTPLDIGAWMAPPQECGGRTQVSVISLAHLSETERAFFLGLLLGRVHAWSRTLPGTSGLRGLLFFDEVAGWIPPHPANPPTKGPLLTLMKQARAVGLGVVLATQNPVDIDYKGLSNAGLWAIGRLQTKQDRDRLLKGLGRPDLDSVVEGLGKRRFLIHRAKAPEPSVVASRFAMCFLRGPMTSTDLERLGARAAEDVAPAASAGAPAPAASRPQAPAPPPRPATPDDGLLGAPPPAPGETVHFLDPRVAFSDRLDGRFADHAEAHRDDGQTVWRPALYAALELTFDEDRVGFRLDERIQRVWFPLGDRLPDESLAVSFEDGDLDTDTPEGRFAPLPDWLDEAKERKALAKRVVDEVYRSESRGMFVQKALKLYGRGDESLEDFKDRCKEAIEDKVDEQVAKLKDRYETKVDRLEDRIRKKEAQLVEVNGAIRTAKAAEVVNVGETVWAMFSGRRKSLSTAMSKRSATVKKEARAESLGDDVASLREEVFDLEQELELEVNNLRAEGLTMLADIEEKEVRLEKNDIRLVSFGLLWVPVSRRI